MGLCHYHQGGLTKRCQVFEIGMPRTGTRSIREAVLMLGFTARHGFGRCEECGRDAKEKFLWGQSDFDIYETADCVGGISHVHWRQLAESRPDAKFILSIRPLEKWLRPWKLRHKTTLHRMRAVLEEPIKWPHLLRLHHFGMVAFNKQRWSEDYLKHNEDVMDHFQDSERLLMVDVFQDSDLMLWKRLSSFLGRLLPDPLPDFPYVKKGRDRSDRKPRFKHPPESPRIAPDGLREGEGNLMGSMDGSLQEPSPEIPRQ